LVLPVRIKSRQKSGRLQSSTTTIQQIIDAPDKGILDEVLKGAKCIATVPSMIKGAFIFGGANRSRRYSACDDDYE
jgi:lipid-binding SYLF domain-containing protein